MVEANNTPEILVYLRKELKTDKNERSFYFDHDIPGKGYFDRDSQGKKRRAVIDFLFEKFKMPENVLRFSIHFRIDALVTIEGMTFYPELKAE